MLAVIIINFPLNNDYPLPPFISTEHVSMCCMVILFCLFINNLWFWMESYWLLFFPCSIKDWKFAAEEFVRMLPDKVVVHCKDGFIKFYFLVLILFYCCGWVL